MPNYMHAPNYVNKPMEYIIWNSQKLSMQETSIDKLETRGMQATKTKNKCGILDFVVAQSVTSY